MAGLDPAIHQVDARVKPAHDRWCIQFRRNPLSNPPLFVFAKIALRFRVRQTLFAAASAAKPAPPQQAI
jgi:hypothetical protein